MYPIGGPKIQADCTQILSCAFDRLLELRILIYIFTFEMHRSSYSDYDLRHIKCFIDLFLKADIYKDGKIFQFQIQRSVISDPVLPLYSQQDRIIPVKARHFIDIQSFTPSKSIENSKLNWGRSNSIYFTHFFSLYILEIPQNAIKESQFKAEQFN